MCAGNTDSILDLSGKVAAVSGGSSGIGYSTAELLSRQVVLSVILDIDEAKYLKGVI